MTRVFEMNVMMRDFVSRKHLISNGPESQLLTQRYVNENYE